MRSDTKAHPNGAGPAEGAAVAADPEIKIAASWEELIGLIPPWTALAAGAGASGFARPEFCIPCWSEAARGQAWVAQAWQGDDLLAVAPMWATRTGPATVLSSIGTGPATRAELLFLPGREDAVRALIDSAAASFTGLVVEHAEGASFVPASAPPARRVGATSTVVLATADRPAVLPGGPVTVDDADAYDTGHQRTDWFVAGAGRPLPLALVRTVIDTALRSGVAVVVRDGWRGGSIWLAGTDEVELWCASGSCRPGAGQWTAALAAVSRWAADRGLAAVRTPAVGGTAGPAIGVVERRDVTVVASSTRRLWVAAAAARRLESVRQEAS